MQIEYRLIIALFFVLVFPSASDTFAQQPTGKCEPGKFSERMTSTRRYRLHRVEGQAVYGAVAEKGELNGAADVCVALFNRSNRRLIDSVPTSTGGQFKFAEVPTGKYVLVVSVSELHELVIPLDVSSTSKATFKHWELLLHLRSKDDRKKSYVTPITQPDLRAELLKLEREGQAVRNEMIQQGSDHVDKSLEARMLTIDSPNTLRLKAIVRRYGWPGPELVGVDGANAAFMLLQHSPNLAFQQEMLPLVQRSYQRGKLSAWNYALLADRVRVRTGKKQLYGMSLERWSGKEPVVSPIEDEVNVDKRRAKIGLGPLSEYLDFMKRLYFPNE